MAPTPRPSDYVKCSPVRILERLDISYADPQAKLDDVIDCISKVLDPRFVDRKDLADKDWESVIHALKVKYPRFRDKYDAVKGEAARELSNCILGVVSRALKARQAPSPPAQDTETSAGGTRDPNQSITLPSFAEAFGSVS